jgi:hypothetical protein
MKSYAVIKNPKKPKRDPRPYLIVKAWVLPFLIDDRFTIPVFGWGDLWFSPWPSICARRDVHGRDPSG